MPKGLTILPRPRRNATMSTRVEAKTEDTRVEAKAEYTRQLAKSNDAALLAALDHLRGIVVDWKRTGGA